MNRLLGRPTWFVAGGVESMTLRHTWVTENPPKSLCQKPAASFDNSSIWMAVHQTPASTTTHQSVPMPAEQLPKRVANPSLA